MSTVVRSGERVLCFGLDQRLVGTLLDARGGSSSDLVVLFFNAGLIPRTGPHRLWVKLARHLAPEGISSFRFDLAGQGDSAVLPDPAPFETQAVNDIIAAMDAAQAHTGIKRFAIVGICSGAALGYQTALVDPRVAACAMIDVYMYPTLKTHLLRIQHRIRKVGMFTVLKDWIGFSFNSVAVKFGLRRAGSEVPSALPGLVRPSGQAFAQGLQKLLDRKTELLMIYTGSFLYRYNYAEQFRDYFRRYRLRGPLRVEFDASIDHTVTEQSAQARVIARVMDWLHSSQITPRR